MISNQPYLIIGTDEETLKYCVKFSIENIYNNYSNITINNFFSFSSVLIIKPTNNSYKKAEIEDIINFLSLNSSNIPGILIIESAHILGNSYSQLFLQLFENIPNNIYIFLLTQFINNLPLAIQSRCLKIFLNKQDQSSNNNEIDSFINFLFSKNLSSKEINDLFFKINFTEIETKEIIQKSIEIALKNKLFLENDKNLFILKKLFKTNFFYNSINNILKILFIAIQKINKY